MRALSDADLLSVWETGLRQHTLERALTLLQAAFPEVARGTLARLTIGQRDSCLLVLRKQTFGSTLTSLVACPTCQAQFEFVLDETQLQIKERIELQEEIFKMSIEQGEIWFRLPNSLDLEILLHGRERSLQRARHLLLQRCVLQVLKNGLVAVVEDLDEEQIGQVAQQMDKQDHLAEILLDMDCSACGSSWQIVFDIVSFFWSEIHAHVKRLLSDIHSLARAYSWREEDILAMSRVRRQIYLEMVNA